MPYIDIIMKQNLLDRFLETDFMKVLSEDDRNYYYEKSFYKPGYRGSLQDKCSLFEPTIDDGIAAFVLSVPAGILEGTYKSFVAPFTLFHTMVCLKEDQGSCKKKTSFVQYALDDFPEFIKSCVATTSYGFVQGYFLNKIISDPENPLNYTLLATNVLCSIFPFVKHALRSHDMPSRTDIG